MHLSLKQVTKTTGRWNLISFFNLLPIEQKYILHCVLLIEGGVQVLKNMSAWMFLLLHHLTFCLIWTFFASVGGVRKLRFKHVLCHQAVSFTPWVMGFLNIFPPTAQMVMENNLSHSLWNLFWNLNSSILFIKPNITITTFPQGFYNLYSTQHLEHMLKQSRQKI